MHILTYTNVYIHIRIYTWKYVCWMIRCELWCAASALQWLGLGAARPLTLTETASGPPGDHWLVTGHRRPAAPVGSAAAEPVTDRAAGPPAGCHCPWRAGRRGAGLMSGRTEHIKQIQFYGSVSSVAHAFVDNMWNNWMMIQTEPTWLYTLGTAVDHENSHWNVTGSRLYSVIFLSPTFLIVTLPGRVTAQ